MWNDRIVLLGSLNFSNDEEFGIMVNPLLEALFSDNIERPYRSYRDIANELFQIPGDVLSVLLYLEDDRLVEEGSGKLKGHFRLKAAHKSLGLKAQGNP